MKTDNDKTDKIRQVFENTDNDRTKLYVQTLNDRQINTVRSKDRKLIRQTLIRQHCITDCC